jgi:hypothetical protein
MADGLGFPFEVGGPSSGSVTNFRKAAFRNYREDPAILGSTGAAATVIQGEACPASLAGHLRSEVV